MSLWHLAMLGGTHGELFEHAPASPRSWLYMEFLLTIEQLEQCYRTAERIGTSIFGF